MRGDTILGYKLVRHPMEGLLVKTGGGREKLIRESHQSSSKLRKTRRGGRGYEMIRRGNFEEWHNPPLLLQAGNDEQNSKSNASESDPIEEINTEVETDQDINKGDQSL